jgi:hypothetical protein
MYRFLWLAILSTLPVLAACSLVTDRGQTVTQANIPLEELSEFQQEVFADGEVSFEEYERSFLALVDCIAAEGIEVDGPILEVDTTYSFITTESIQNTEAVVDTAVASCSERYTSAVELGYADSIAPSEEEERLFYERVAQCVRSAGIPVDGTDPNDLAAARVIDTETYDQCFESIMSITS